MEELRREVEEELEWNLIKSLFEVRKCTGPTRRRGVMKEAPRDIKLTQEKEQRKLGCWTVGKISFLWP